MRRAMRHVHKLGIKDPHMYRLVDSLKNQMGESFTELNRAKLLIENTLKEEEIKFRETLERGLGLLDQSIQNLNNSQHLISYHNLDLLLLLAFLQMLSMSPMYVN